MRRLSYLTPASPLLNLRRLGEKGLSDGDQRYSAKPFLKWPGGKRLIAPQVLRHAPSTYGRYFEPFVGGAALFFHLRPAAATLSDRNVELMNCYEQVRDNVERVIAQLSRLRNTEYEYYRVRGVRCRTPITRAAQFIYLVNLAFNGIYRVNFDGRFNVPYGDRPHLRPATANSLRSASKSLQGVDLLACDFETAVADAKEGDFVYLDPPYTVAHSNNGFIRYNDHLFSWPDQERLAGLAANLAQRGCYVVISNAAHGHIRSLYSGFEVAEIHRSSAIAADPKHRTRVVEFVLRSRNCP